MKDEDLKEQCMACLSIEGKIPCSNTECDKKDYCRKVYIENLVNKIKPNSK